MCLLRLNCYLSFSVLIITSRCHSHRRAEKENTQDGGDTAPECYTRALSVAGEIFVVPRGCRQANFASAGRNMLLPLLVVVSLRAVGVRPLQSHLFFFQ